MSGLATIAAVVGAGAALGSTAYGVVNGQAQQANQQKALVAQNTAQQKAQASALSNERQSAVAEGAANQQTPDLTAILQRAATTGKGLTSTMLTGSAGVNAGSLTLGKSTLLGG
jgi:uncharacterized protein HemX